MAALHAVAVAAGGATDEQKLAELVVQRSLQVVGGDLAVLRWFEQASSSFRLLASTGSRADLDADIAADARTSVSRAFQSGQAVITNDYLNSDQATIWGLRHKIRAQLAVPLLVEGRPVGTLGVVSFADHRYRQADADFLSLVGALVAPSLEAVRLNRAVRHHDELVSQIYEALPLAVIVFDRTGKAVYNNKAAESLLGHDSLAGIRRRTLVLYREDGTPMPHDERPSTSALRTGVAVRNAVVGIGEGSARRWVLLDAVPIAGADGTVESLVTCGLEITSLKAAEERHRLDAEALRASEQRLRAVIETAPDPIVTLDAAGRIVDFNPAAERTFLRSRDEMRGESGSVLLPDMHHEAFARWLREGAKAGSAEYAGQHFETTGRRGDGSVFPMEIAVANLPKETRLMAAFVRDLTMRERLKESSERMAAVLATAPVILFACDSSGTVTFAQGEELKKFALTPEAAVGHDVRELLKPSPDATELMNRALQGEAVTGQAHMVRSDRYLHAYLTPTSGPSGQAAGVSGVLVDVTDRVRADIAVRTSETKSRLMAMMNHEVRTPLNSILGFAHMLGDVRTGELSDRQRRYVANIQTAGNHLLTLINDSLEMSKLDAGRAGVQSIDVAVDTVIAQASDQVRPLADARDLRLLVESSPGLKLRADPKQLLQVLLNLLANAIRHTPERGSVTVKASPAASEVEITVADTGCGIAPADLGRIFQEFFQAENHAPGGIGLGLSISRRLVQMMGGTISVESELGKGSTFTVRLPLSKPAE